jgi:hypothetical protein
VSLIPGVALAPAAESELTGLAAGGQGLPDKVAGLPNDPRQLTTALSFVQARLKAIEDTRLGIAEPMNRAKSNLDAHFRNLKAPYEQAKDVLKNRLEAIEVARRAALAEANAPKPLASGEARCGVDADAVFTTPSVGQAVGSFRDEWTWELEDISKIPLEFLAVNAATVKLYLSKHKHSQEVPPIPGLRFTKVPKAIAR